MPRDDWWLQYYAALQADGWLCPADAEALTAQRDRLEALLVRYEALTTKVFAAIQEIQERIAADRLFTTTQGGTTPLETSEGKRHEQRHQTS